MMFIRLHKPTIVCLLEPKVSEDQANRICSSFGFEEWIRVEAVGFSGGIWILWRNTIVIEAVETHPQFITIRVVDNVARALLVTGDFNSVLSQEEVSNPETFSLARCVDFNQWICREGLLDLGYSGAKYTWTRGLGTSTFKGARLDRALGNVERKLRYSEAEVEHLPRINSDHTPLLINTRSLPSGRMNRQFRYNMAWATHLTFQQVVRHSWDNNKNVEINKEKMAVALATWNVSTFGNVFHRKKKLLARINVVQRRMVNQLRPDLTKLDKKLKQELEEVLFQEELIWF
ncbi:uncharacterized protein LOC115999320 [Ipomoea triloba]|uniref:uncharacterized protein LOC115999320 n=1 Tax=Ipomoea triloba TaxID=35885 RepID=UPI00125D0517|nr:uncharacterized protein LOC115999320 [Ipomoea triloba]